MKFTVILKMVWGESALSTDVFNTSQFLLEYWNTLRICIYDTPILMDAVLVTVASDLKYMFVFLHLMWAL